MHTGATTCRRLPPSFYPSDQPRYAAIAAAGMTTNVASCIPVASPLAASRQDLCTISAALRRTEGYVEELFLQFKL
jgi:hypothetical protein